VVELSSNRVHRHVFTKLKASKHDVEASALAFDRTSRRASPWLQARLRRVLVVRLPTRAHEAKALREVMEVAAVHTESARGGR
jgi:hypothetical protein